MKSFTLNDETFADGIVYHIGLSDGRSFKGVIFKGRSNNAGKPILRFATQYRSELIINPSYMAWALEEKGTTEWAD